MPSKKSKEKIFFVISWTRKYKTPITPPLLKRLGFILLAIFLVVAIGVGSGGLNFIAGTIGCRALPVEASSFLTKTIIMPGEKDYGPSPFATYKYCTREQAQAAGYVSSTPSEEEKKAAEAQVQAREEAARFSPAKVDYTVYVPVLEGYEITDIYLSEIHSSSHTFMKIKKNGTVIGQIREVPVDNEYNICQEADNPKQDYCAVIGHDAAGREIKRSYHNGIKGWQSYYVGINIDGTGIILSTDDDTEAVLLLSLLQQYVEGNNG